MIPRYLLAAFVLSAFTPAVAQVPSLVRDINTNGNSDARDITCINGKVYFRADDGVHGLEPWVSDGTTAGTFMLKDIYPGEEDGYPVSFIDFNGAVYFAANDGNGLALWSTDGTEAGTQLEILLDGLQDLEYSSRFTVYNDMVIFVGRSDIHGSELWVTDGTVAGTRFVKDIYPGSSDSDPREFTAYNGLIYFAAETPEFDEELWVTDGTTEGTRMLKDIDEGPGSGEPLYFTEVNGLLYFKADDGNEYGAELWVTDGTEEGTTMVMDIVPGGSSSLPRNLVAFNNELWFVAGLGGAAALWHSDGTEEGTQMLPVGDEPYGIPGDLVAHGGNIFFSAGLSGLGSQLLKTDGTPEGTEAVLMPGSTVVGALQPAVGIASCGDFILYAANYDTSIGIEPYTLLSPVGISEAERFSADRLYPNPASHTLFMTDAPPNATLRLYAADGCLALETSVRKMDIGALPAGLYLARVTAANGTLVHTQPLVKE